MSDRREGVFHVKHEAWLRTAADLGITLPDAAPERLERYRALLLERAAPAGMIGRADLARVESRHILDSLRGGALMPEGAASVCDLGSGAGLPGIPLAIARPDDSVTLTETRRSRVAFLELAVDALDLIRVSVFFGRAKDAGGPFDVCLARAFAGPSETWHLARQLLRQGGTLLYWGGERFRPSGFKGTEVTFEVIEPGLAGSGPIVMMTRQ